LADCFHHAQVHPNATSLLLAVHDIDDEELRSLYTHIARTILRVPALCLMPACVLALAYAGQDHGVVVSLGHDIISCSVVGVGGAVQAHKQINLCMGVNKSTLDVWNYGDRRPATGMLLYRCPERVTIALAATSFSL
jgi:hypothetical protein